jgi:hypothetical protein
VACRPIRENATLRMQTSGGIRRSAGDLAAAPSRRQPDGHSCYRSPGLRLVVDYRIAHTSLRQCNSMPRHSVIDVRRDVEAALSPDNIREFSGDSTFSNLREVIMTMSEYEERFRPRAPSLHQTFAEVRGPNRGERRSRRRWVTAALVGAMAMTSETALHHSSHTNGSQGSKSAIQACDFIHR